MFKRISAAFDILGDPEKRQKYDAGEIDASGRETGGYGDFGSGGARRYKTSENFGEFGDIFSDFFGRTGQGSGTGRRLQHARDGLSLPSRDRLPRSRERRQEARAAAQRARRSTSRCPQASCRARFSG